MNNTHRNVLPFHPRLDRRPDGISKLCTVIIIVCGHLSIDFLLYYIERMFVIIVKQNTNFVKSPTRYAQQDNIDTNSTTTKITFSKGSQRSIEAYRPVCTFSGGCGHPPLQIRTSCIQKSPRIAPRGVNCFEALQLPVYDGSLGCRPQKGEIIVSKHIPNRSSIFLKPNNQFPFFR